MMPMLKFILVLHLLFFCCKAENPALFCGDLQRKTRILYPGRFFGPACWIIDENGLSRLGQNGDRMLLSVAAMQQTNILALPAATPYPEEGGFFFDF